jgi:hypothetical protein
MTLYNVKFGWTTSSSSNHSIVIFPPDADIVDSDVEGWEFGWQCFTAVSRESKVAYLALCLDNTLYGFQKFPADVRTLIVKDWTGLEARPGINIFDNVIEGWVDHQSSFCLPQRFDRSMVHRQFYDELLEYLCQFGLAILGAGEDSVHPLRREGKDIDLCLPQDMNAQRVARKDFDYWTLFNDRTGTKVRVDFRNSDHLLGLSCAPERSEKPETVDIKITDFCPQNCPWCYQGSSLEGRHAETHEIESLAYALASLEVFEVALGGGDPTLHPNFARILDTFGSYHIRPNFSTRSVAWLEDPKIVSSVQKNVGGAAFSARSVEDVDLFVDAIRGCHKVAARALRFTMSWARQPKRILY